jgi:hypothetical protein
VQRHGAALRLHHLQVVLDKLFHLGHVHAARRRLAEKLGTKPGKRSCCSPPPCGKFGTTPVL